MDSDRSTLTGKPATFHGDGLAVNTMSTMDTYSSRPYEDDDSESEGSFENEESSNPYDSYANGIVDSGLRACGMDRVGSIETQTSLISYSSEDEDGVCGVINALDRKSTIRREYAACGEHDHSNKLWSDRRKNDDLRYLSKFAAKINAEKQLPGGPSPILSLVSTGSENNSQPSSDNTYLHHSKAEHYETENSIVEDARRVLDEKRDPPPKNEEERRGAMSTVTEGITTVTEGITSMFMDNRETQDTRNNDTVEKRDPSETVSVITSSTNTTKTTSNTTTSNTRTSHKGIMKEPKYGYHREKSDTVSVVTTNTASTKKSRKMKEKKILKNQQEHGGAKLGLLGWRKKKNKAYKMNEWTKDDSDRIEL